MEAKLARSWRTCSSHAPSASSSSGAGSSSCRAESELLSEESELPCARNVVVVVVVGGGGGSGGGGVSGGSERLSSRSLPLLSALERRWCSSSEGRRCPCADSKLTPLKDGGRLILLRCSSGS